MADTPDDEEPPRLVFFKEDVEIISQVLVTLLQNTRARAVLLVDKDGHVLTREGDFSPGEMNALSDLGVDFFASSRRGAEPLGYRRHSIHFYERDDIKLSRVGERTIMAVVIGSAGSLDMVRIYADQVAGKLSEFFGEVARRGRKGPDLGEGAGAPACA